MAASTPLPKSVGVGQDRGPGRWGVVGWAAGDEEGKIGRDCRTETGTETERHSERLRHTRRGTQRVTTQRKAESEMERQAE